MTRSLRAAAAAALCVAALCGCSHGASGQQGPPPLAVDVATAQRQDLATYVVLDGQISPLQNATLSTPQSGTVTAVYVNEGQRVGQGQLLAQLDTSTLRAQLAQNEAAVAQNRSQVSSQTLQGNITPSQAQATVVSAEQQLATARNNVATAVAALSNAKLVYDSNNALYGQGYVAQTSLEQARATYVQAQQTLNSARETERQAEVALTQARAQGTNAVPIQNQAIAGSVASLQAARAAVKLLQTQIAQSSLYAPFEGVITERLLDPGAFAGPNQPIVQLSQVDRVYVNINVPDSDLSYVRKGTTVTFTSSSVPGRTWSGSIYDVNATPTTGTLSYRARIVMPNPDNALRGGMLVSVSARTAEQPNAIVVPRSAVVQAESGATGVYTVEPLPAKPGSPAGPLQFAHAKFVPVRVGIETDTQAGISGAGITAGTKIITTRPDALQDKSLVAYAPAGGSGAPQGGAPSQADAP